MSAQPVVDPPATTSPAPLRELRLGRSLGSVDLAQRLGVHPTTLLRWERGERLPGPRHVVGLARELGLETLDVAAAFDPWRRPPSGPDAVPGHGLRDLRRAAGVRVAQLAETAGVRPSTVYNWEHGRARVPAELLPVLAAALGTTADGLRARMAGAAARRPARSDSPLRRLRRRTGLSQAQVSARIGVDRQSLGCWERGRRPPLHALRRLASAYGVPVSTVADAAGVVAPAELDPRSWRPERTPAVLRVLREWSGFTQRQIAERCGCSVAAVRGWEAGRGRPRAATLRRLEGAYGLAAGALVNALEGR